ncbi:MAG: hypothetical protein OQK77_03375 [Psychromonas sp.]|nr:hypothetical protein [Psychromonas sp.]
MGKSNNHSQQLDDETEYTEEWEYENEWEEETVHARKEHQNHRGRVKGQVRRNIEDFKEQQQLKQLLGEDLYD